MQKNVCTCQLKQKKNMFLKRNVCICTGKYVQSCYRDAKKRAIIVGGNAMHVHTCVSVTNVQIWHVLIYCQLEICCIAGGVNCTHENDKNKSKILKKQNSKKNHCNTRHV